MTNTTYHVNATPNSIVYFVWRVPNRLRVFVLFRARRCATYHHTVRDAIHTPADDLSWYRYPHT